MAEEKRLSNQEYYSKLDAAKERIRKAFADLELSLAKRGYRLRGTFDIVETRTGFYSRHRKE